MLMLPNGCNLVIREYTVTLAEYHLAPGERISASEATVYAPVVENLEGFELCCIGDF